MTEARECNMAILNQRTGAIIIALVIIFIFFAVPVFAEKVTMSLS